MNRTYECRNRMCNNYRISVTVYARPFGPYWEWPAAVTCDCGHEVPVVTVNGKSVGPIGIGEHE